ncbi:tetratricopeptide repeat protein [Malonomonas rubra]|uniref:tetratricopeptide repeat protein n=1 Tax=Malonomonas rubra TaxID=57040 RepID=UPI0026EDC453|nr:tetratricopeptide repeat protein [Malonomonas rubra]
MSTGSDFQPNLSGRPVCLTIEEATQTALCLHQSGALPEAELIYKRTIQTAPDDLNALHYYGLLCHQQDRHKEATELIQQIINLAQNNADAHNNLGNVMEGLGRIDEAERCYLKAIELLPAHAPAYNNLGVILMDQNTTAEALEAYSKATSLNSNSADFQYNLGNALRRTGNYSPAAEAYHRAVQLNPEHAGAWQGQAQALVLDGRKNDAEQMFEEWQESDPANPIIPYLKASCLSEQAPERAPNAYVEQIFDDMAERFNAHLLENLEYRAPALIAEVIKEQLPESVANLDVLDAGCGTGLCADFLLPYAKHLCGVDLSAGMLQKASGRQAYDELRKAELPQFMAQAPESYDLIVSADTLCYFGELGAVTQAASQALRPGGLLAFTLEDAGGGQDVVLNETGRYAHR